MNNMNKLNDLFVLTSDLKILINDSFKQIEYFFSFLKDKDKRKTLSEKGFIAYKKVYKLQIQSFNDVCEICWNLSEDEKYEKCFIGKELISLKIQNKTKTD